MREQPFLLRELEFPRDGANDACDRTLVGEIQAIERLIQRLAVNLMVTVPRVVGNFTEAPDAQLREAVVTILRRILVDPAT